MKPPKDEIVQPPKVLTIAGSDSGGAAGLQADLKTFTTLGVYGMSAVTAVTAQNSEEIKVVHPVPNEVVAAQIDAVLGDYGADSVKTGLIGRVEIIKTIAELLQSHKQAKVIIDPVLVNHRGDSMFTADVVAAYVKYLLPIADVITPNLAEASILTGRSVRSRNDMEKAARIILGMGPRGVLIKGFREKTDVVDLLSDQVIYTQFRSRWIDTKNTHGSGDTLSAAICALLALGLSLIDAVQKAHDFTRQAILFGADWEMGSGHGPIWHQSSPDPYTATSERPES